MGRATRTECHCQRWVKNKNKMRESCWHAQAGGSFAQIQNVRQLEISITPQRHRRAEVLKVVSSLVCGFYKCDTFNKSGRSVTLRRSLSPWCLIHFDEATDRADAAEAEIFFLAKRWQHLLHHGGAKWCRERAKDGGAAAVISGAVCEVNESDRRFRCSWTFRAITGKRIVVLLLFIGHFWWSVCYATIHSLAQYLRLWTIQRRYLKKVRVT